MAGDAHQSDGTAKIVEVLLLVLAGLAALWLGTCELAALVFGGHHPLPDAGGVIVGLVGVFRHPGNPRLGWPAADRADLPGAIPLYVTALVVAGALCAAGWFSYKLYADRFGPLGAPGSRRKHRLGSDPRARLAEQVDVAPLIVDSAKPGRLVLGRLMQGKHPGPLLATEDEGEGAHVSKERRGGPSRGGRASVVVVGPSRSGKTSGFAIPAILEWNGPVIAFSVKDDLLRNTIHRRQRVGTVQIFDPRRALPDGYGTPSCWTPLRRCGTLAGASRAAKALMAGVSSGQEKDPTWNRRAGELLAPYFLAAALDHRDMGTVAQWVDEQDGVHRGRGEDEEELGEAEAILVAAETEDSAIALRRLRAICGIVAATRDGIFSNASSAIAPWVDPEVAASAARSEITLERLFEGNSTLYAVAPAHHQAELEAVFVGLVQDLLDDAYEFAQRNHGVLPRRLLLVLDEAANIAPLQDLPRYASTLAGIGVTLVTIFQDAAQIKTRWKDAAPTVLNNHIAKLALSGISDKETLELLSTLLGEEEYTQTSRSQQSTGGSSTSESTAVRKLVPADLIRRIPSGQGLLLYGSLLPAHVVLRPWYRDPALRALADVDPVKPDRVIPPSADPPPPPETPLGQLVGGDW